MIVISAGMPKAGTAWYYQMTNDLLVAAGFQDAGGVREKFHLDTIMLYETNSVGGSWISQHLLLIPHLMGHSFAIKTHKPPQRMFRLWEAANIAKSTYVFRDPRDAALSAYEHGQRLLARGRRGTFAQLTTLEDAIVKAQEWLFVWQQWMDYGRALVVRYEDLLLNTTVELQRLAMHLSLSVGVGIMEDIVNRYKAENVSALPPEKGKLHFNKGITGRFRQVMTTQQQQMCQDLLGAYLIKMGYDEHSCSNLPPVNVPPLK